MNLNLHPAMRRLLDECGLPWRIEKGSRHHKVVVAERVITILPKSTHALRRLGKRHRNAMAHIKRELRALELQR